jgi:protease-4
LIKFKMRMDNIGNVIWAMQESQLIRWAEIAISKPEYFERMMSQASERKELYLVEGSAKVSSSYDYMVNKVPSKNGLIAVIPIMGTMSRYGDWCSWGTEDVASWVMEAANDNDVAGVVLETNSGGGDASGIELLDNAIKQCPKPVVGYVGNAAYSGANWGLAHCDEILVESATISGMGSIGVYRLHMDYVNFLEKEGINVKIIRARGSEKKILGNAYEGLPEEARKADEDDVTAVRETFVKAVKDGRPGVDERVFSGETFNGKECIKLGLADRIGFLGDAINRADKLS